MNKEAFVSGILDFAKRTIPKEWQLSLLLSAGLGAGLGEEGKRLPAAVTSAAPVLSTLAGASVASNIANEIWKNQSARDMILKKFPLVALGGLTGAVGGTLLMNKILGPERIKSYFKNGGVITL